MAYDEELAHRIRAALSHRDYTEKKMFGGLCFMLGGNMCVGIVKEELMVRVGPDNHDEALTQPHTRAMDFTGRPMKGMIYVARDGFARDDGLASWVDRGADFAASLPPKKAKPAKAKPKQAKK